ncbi:unnamed protein product [Owenia fusiformis]|uniref:RNA helicase n=1 Tax=Owenia fusiformis TaxID=6347 RepID=A0A8J1XXZ7_OWEFU|nr:unnamed protein product [Owenia fusiformis]
MPGKLQDTKDNTMGVQENQESVAKTSKKGKKEKGTKKSKAAKEVHMETEPETDTIVKGTDQQLPVSKKGKKSKKNKVEELNGDDTPTELKNGDSKDTKKKRKSKGEPEYVNKEEPENVNKEEPETKKKKIKIEKTESSPKKKKEKKIKVDQTEIMTNGVTNGNVKVESNGVTVKDESEASDSEPELSPDQKAGQFNNFDISKKTVDKLLARGVKYLFPIQAKTFQAVFDGRDVIAQARTGTGKTLSFALPLVEKLQKEAKYGRGRSPKVLVMAPTRELANQVSEDFKSVSDRLAVSCFYGGTPFGPQMSDIRQGIDVLVGTPGRILDHLQKGVLKIDNLKHAILDEVDRMLDMGFADTVDEILQFAYKQDVKPQTLLFSATCPSWVYQTAEKYMKEDLFKIDIIGQQKNKTSTTVQHLAVRCSYFDRAATLGSIVHVYSGNHGRAIIFCEKKRDADELVASPHLKQESHVLHGDVPQQKREQVLKGFKDGKYKCLVATDVAARGLDIPAIDLVVQCSPPRDVDSYIHRSGRTGRAGRMGTCVCFYKPNEERELKTVENRAGIKFKRIGGPTTKDIIRASAEDAARSLEGIPDATLDHFTESAEKLIEEKGAAKALAAALAVISGCTKIVSRSLLSSNEGYTTYLFRTNLEFERIGYVWRSLEKYIPFEIKEKCMRMRITADKKGAVFDLPSEHDQEVKDAWQDGQYDTLEVANELPELLESADRGSFNRGNRGGFGGNRNSFGGNRNSFGGNNNASFGRNQSPGFRGRSNGYGTKRSFAGSNNSSSSNKKMRFDE